MKTLFFVTVFITGQFFVNAQSGNLITAFTLSYKLEAKADYAGAIKALKDVYDEKSYEINLRLGWLSYENGLFTESQEYYKKAIDIMPHSIEARLGYIYPASALKNWDRVISQYKNILAVDPQNTTANYRLGNIYYEKKDYENAYKCFEKVVNMYPFGYDALLMFAWSNFRTGKTREAKVLFNKMLLVSPGDKSALEGLRMIK